MDPILGLVIARSLGLFGGSSSSSSSSARPRPSLPAPGPAPAPVPFPSQIPDAPQPASPHMKKAIEIWAIDPRAVLSLPAVVGDDVTVETLESTFPRGWKPVPQASVTPQMYAKAKALLSVWVKGRVLFDGAKTTQARRAYVMTEHPGGSSPAAPASPAAAPPGYDPISRGPAPVPPAPEPAPLPHDAPPPSPTTHKITTVRKGEGLANIAIRLLGAKQGNVAWPELRQANLPVDADGRKRKKAPDTKGGIAPILQPGQRLFIPDNWEVDPALL